MVQSAQKPINPAQRRPPEPEADVRTDTQFQRQVFERGESGVVLRNGDCVDERRRVRVVLAPVGNMIFIDYSLSAVEFGQEYWPHTGAGHLAKLYKN